MSSRNGSESKGAVNKRRIYSLVFFLLGVAGITVMLCTMDISAVDWETAFRLMPVWLPVILLLWAGIYAIHVLSWRIIMGEDCRGISFLRLYRITLAGFALNRVTPLGMMGGEPYRIMALQPDMGVEKATAHSITFTITQTFSHTLFWLTGSVIYFILYGFSASPLRSAFMALLGALCLVACITFLFSRQNHLVMRIFRFFGRIPGLRGVIARFLEKNGDALDGIDREMVAFRKRRKPFLLSFLLEYATWVLEVFEYYMIFHILGADMTCAKTLMAVTVSSVVGNLMFFIPMQVGSREGGLALALRWCGVNASVGVSAALFVRMREIVYIVLGVALLLLNERGAGREKEQA